MTYRPSPHPPLPGVDRRVSLDLAGAYSREEFEILKKGLEEAGWVKAEWVMTANKRRARVYELTEAGRQQLEAQETRWRTVTLAVSHVLDRV
jgi:hypothetical protein